MEIIILVLKVWSFRRLVLDHIFKKCNEGLLLLFLFSEKVDGEDLLVDISEGCEVMMKSIFGELLVPFNRHTV